MRWPDDPLSDPVEGSGTGSTMMRSEAPSASRSARERAGIPESRLPRRGGEEVSPEGTEVTSGEGVEVHAEGLAGDCDGFGDDEVGDGVGVEVGDSEGESVAHVLGVGEWETGGGGEVGTGEDGAVSTGEDEEGVEVETRVNMRWMWTMVATSRRPSALRSRKVAEVGWTRIGVVTWPGLGIEPADQRRRPVRPEWMRRGIGMEWVGMSDWLALFP